MPDTAPDTYGWNTAFALRMEDANRLLARPATQTKRYRANASKGSPAPAAQWTFRPWRLAEASGSEVVIATQLAEGQLQNGGKTFDLEGLDCTITCEMVLKPVNRPGDDAKDAHTPQPVPGASRAWAQVEIDNEAGRLEFGDLVALQECLDLWFRTAEALAEFEAHFGGLVISTAEAKDDLAWTMPRAVGFAGAVLPDDSHAFGILARTDDRSIIGCSYQLSPFAIPDGAQAGFVISAETFLRHMLMPALPHVFGGRPGDYRIHDGTKVSNVAALHLSFTADNGRSFTGVIGPKQLDIALSGAELVLRIHNLAIPVDLGPFKKVETIHIEVTHRLGLTLKSPDDDPGHKVLSLVQTANPLVNLSTEESTALVVTKIGVDVVALILGAVASYFLGRGLAARGVSALASRLLAGLLFAIIQAIGFGITKLPDLTRAIELNALREIPAFSAFLIFGLRQVRWPTPTEYEVTSVAFRGGVQIGVRLVTKTG